VRGIRHTLNTHTYSELMTTDITRYTYISLLETSRGFKYKKE